MSRRVVRNGSDNLLSGRAALFGYFGRVEHAEATCARARDQLSLDLIQGPVARNDGTDTAFVLADRDGTACLGATHPDGSFLVVRGRCYDGPPIAEILDDWLRRGNVVFEGLHLEGFVVGWNARTSELQLIRDKYGVEPGYYAEFGDGVLFSDDPQTLLSFGVDPAPHPEAIDAFLTANNFPAPLTPYREIKKIAPGGVVAFTDDGPRVSLWAKYLPVDQIPYDEAVRLIRPVFEGSLQRMWPGEGKAGVLLSGGIDSAMVAVGITRLLGQPLQAFTFRYGAYEGALNEGDRARVVADHLGVPHEEIVVQPLDLMADLDSAVAMYREPFNWGLHTYKLGPIANRGITTVFSGAGADGTGLAKRHGAAHRFNSLPSPLRTVFRSAVRGLRPAGLRRQRKAEWVTRRVDGFGDMFSEDSELSRLQRATLYNDPNLAESGSRLLKSIYDEAASHLPDDDILSLAVMDKTLTFAETGGAWNRAFTRGNGLQGRYPYVDSGFVELGMGAIGTDGKGLIRQLAMQYLPEEAANAPKNPQEMPVGHWIRGPLANPVLERLAELPVGMADIFDADGVRGAVERHVAGSEDNGWQIISLLALESWFRQHAG